MLFLLLLLLLLLAAAAADAAAVAVSCPQNCKFEENTARWITFGALVFVLAHTNLACPMWRPLASMMQPAELPKAASCSGENRIKLLLKSIALQRNAMK